MPKKGFVSLCGAGPGDPGLLTVKGKRLIEEADVIVYDQLANEQLLDLAKTDSERIDVGKRAAHHNLPQEEINRLLVNKACEGKHVVRLKGGDPFVFGRGGEEAKVLREQGIPFEIVPGVTSATAVPAYAGIPVTHRDLTATVTFVTGHEAAHNHRIPWEALAKMQGTLVFFMGLSNLEMIAQELMSHGAAPETGAAVIAHGTRNDQQTVTAPLKEIAARVREASLKTPALIVVGEVVRFREQLQWFEERPLFAKRILVTAEERLAKETATVLSGMGAEVSLCPLIRVQTLADGWDALSGLFREEDFPFDRIVLTSANGARLFFETLGLCGRDLRFLGNVRVAVVGEKTKEECGRFGLIPDLVPERYDAKALAEEILRDAKETERILLPRAKRGGRELPETLAGAGHTVTEIFLYDTPTCEDVKDRLREASADCDWVTFASASAVHAFFEMLPGECAEQIRKEHSKGRGASFAVIGPVTGEALQSYGIAADAIPQAHTVSDMVKAICTREETKKDKGGKQT